MTNRKGTRIGGTFAPPLDSKKLKKYRELSTTADRPIQKAMEGLLSLVEKYKEMSPQKRDARGSRAHPSGTGRIVDLDDEIAEALKDGMIDDHEFEMFSKLFDSLPTGTSGETYQIRETPDGREYRHGLSNVVNQEQKELRDACFHLLWFARELQLGREPLTNDKL